MISVGYRSGTFQVFAHHVCIVIDSLDVVPVIDVTLTDATLIEELCRSAHVPTTKSTFGTQEVHFGHLHDVQRSVEHIVLLEDAAAQHWVGGGTLSHTGMNAFTKSNDARIRLQHLARLSIYHSRTVVLEQRHISCNVRVLQTHQQTFERCTESGITPSNPNHVQRMRETQLRLQKGKLLVLALYHTSSDGFLCPLLGFIGNLLGTMDGDTQFQRVGQTNPGLHASLTGIFVLADFQILVHQSLKFCFVPVGTSFVVQQAAVYVVNVLDDGAIDGFHSVIGERCFLPVREELEVGSGSVNVDDFLRSIVEHQQVYGLHFGDGVDVGMVQHWHHGVLYHQIHAVGTWIELRADVVSRLQGAVHEIVVRHCGILSIVVRTE